MVATPMDLTVMGVKIRGVPQESKLGVRYFIHHKTSFITKIILSAVFLSLNFYSAPVGRVGNQLTEVPVCTITSSTMVEVRPGQNHQKRPHLAVCRLIPPMENSRAAGKASRDYLLVRFSKIHFCNF